MTQENQYIDRPPRIQPELPQELIQIPSPPDKEKTGTQPLIQVLLPLFTIGGYILVSLFGGRNLLMILPMGIAVIASSLYAFYSYYQESKNQGDVEKSYLQQLNQMQKELIASHNMQRLYYRYNYPNPESIYQIAEGKEKSRLGPRLWERRINDHDFGTLRLGMGTRPSTVVYQFKNDDQQDHLSQEANRLAQDSLYVDDIPITLSLHHAENPQSNEEGPINVQHTIGIVGDELVTDDFVRSLAMHWTAFHSPTDAQLYVTGFPEAKSRWEWAVGLPHVNSRSHTYIGDRMVFGPTERDYSRFWDNLKSMLDKRSLQLADDDEGQSQDVKIPFLLVIVDLTDYYNTDTGNSQLEDLESIPAVSMILNQGHILGTALIIIVPEGAKVPSDCRAVIETEATGKEFVFRYAEVGVNRPRYIGVGDTINNEIAEKFAEKLRDLEVRVSYSAEITRYLDLLDLFELYDEEHSIETVADLPFERNWQQYSKARDQVIGWLEVPLGIKSGNKVSKWHFYQDADGVHGMIAGTTGSGKSELLLTMIAGMAIKYDPRVLNFVLVDYKGGSAFDPFRNLPHTVDIVTNLDGRAVERMFTAIKAELDKRGDMLTRYGVKHIVEYREKGYHLKNPLHPDLPPEPFPHLFVIVDEFAEMVQENAEYKSRFESITRLGRAYGVSLILATQRPTGVVTDQMRANMKYRICLRVETTDDSRELLRRSDAAFLPSNIPGRAYFQAGNNEIPHLVQVARAGGEYSGYVEAIEQPIEWLPFIQVLQPVENQEFHGPVVFELEVFNFDFNVDDQRIRVVFEPYESEEYGQPSSYDFVTTQFECEVPKGLYTVHILLMRREDELCDTLFTIPINVVESNVEPEVLDDTTDTSGVAQDMSYRDKTEPGQSNTDSSGQLAETRFKPEEIARALSDEQRTRDPGTLTLVDWVVGTSILLAEQLKIPDQTKPWPDPLPNSSLDLEHGGRILPLNGPFDATYINYPFIQEDVETQKKYLELVPEVSDWLNGMGRWDQPVKWIQQADAQDGSRFQRLALRANIGILDDPVNARQHVLELNLTRGHLAIFGSSRMGKTTILASLVTALAVSHTPEELQIYAFDFGQGGFEGLFRSLPHIGEGGIVESTDLPKVERLIRMLRNIVEERKNEIGSQSLVEYNAQQQGNGKIRPATLVLIDNFVHFKEAYEDMLPELTALIREGLNFGLYFVLTANQTGDVPGKIFNLFSQRFTLHLPDHGEYTNIIGRGVPNFEEIEGRGAMLIDRKPLEFQIAVPIAPNEPVSVNQKLDIGQHYIDLAENMHQVWVEQMQKDRPHSVERLPEQLMFSDMIEQLQQLQKVDGNLKKRIERNLYIPLGIRDLDRKPELLDMERNGPHFMVIGPPLSGKTTALRAIVMGLTQTYSPEKVGIILFDPNGRLDNYGGKHRLNHLPHVLAYVTNQAEMESAINHLEADFDEQRQAELRQEDSDAYTEEERSGPAIFLIMDQFDNFDEIADRNQMARLTSLIGRYGGKAGKQGDLPGIFAVIGTQSLRPGSSSPARGDFQKRIQANSYGLVLQDPQIAQNIGIRVPKSMLSTEYPPGRGLVYRRVKLSLMQVAQPFNDLLENELHLEDSIARFDKLFAAIMRKYHDRRAQWFYQGREEWMMYTDNDIKSQDTGYYDPENDDTGRIEQQKAAHLAQTDSDIDKLIEKAEADGDEDMAQIYRDMKDNILQSLQEPEDE